MTCCNTRNGNRALGNCVFATESSVDSVTFLFRVKWESTTALVV